MTAMPIGAIAKFPNQCRSSIICIDQYENKAFVGALHNLCFAEPLVFHNLMQLIDHIDMLLNYMAFPQASTERRSFSSIRPMELTEQQLKKAIYEASSAPDGKLGTFSIRILFRQNASWQGSVRWLEENKEKQFRSALELIFLLDSAILAKQDNTDSLFDEKTTATG